MAATWIYKLLLGGLFLASASALSARAQGTAFTYQGRLNDGANPANGRYDLQFALYDDASSPGSVVSVTNTLSGIAVSNGLFTVTLDFGYPDSLTIFDGQEIWLGIAVRTNSTGNTGYTMLLPRLIFTSTPYAITARNLGDTLSSNAFSGIYSSAVTLNNSANHFSGAFTGNGANVTNVNAAKLGGLPLTSFWQTSGNTGTFPGANILGTTDNQPLVFWVNGSQVLKILPTTDTANWIGGCILNASDPAVVGATIAGGGTGNFLGFSRINYVRGSFAVIGGGAGNTASNIFSTISGGLRNVASGIGAVVGGGGYNGSFVMGNQANGLDSTVCGGFGNTASGDYSVLGGGFLNIVSGDYATMGGGDNNTNSSLFGTVAGGYENTASGVTSELYGPAFGATVGGGEHNSARGNASTIAGGYLNTADGFYATIGGGEVNAVNGDNATVAGGNSNFAAGSGTVSGGEGNDAGPRSAVGGGYHNIAGGVVATIPGGWNCAAAGDDSFAAGVQAKANHQGSFVWADDHMIDFADSSSNQFLIRASGGVGIGTSTPETALHVADVGGITIGQSATGGGYTALRMDLSAAQNGYAELQAISQGGTSYGNLVLQANGGRIAVGKINPNSLLDVFGTITCLSLNQTSDRGLKEHFSPVSPREVLAKVAALPISRWDFINEPATPHVGPMAQDFHAAFGLGTDDKHIATVDEGGVALAAIQGLNQRLNEKDTEIQELKHRLEVLEKMIRNQPATLKSPP